MIKKRKGFSLAELMVIVFIIGVLIAIATPMWMQAKARSEARACSANLQIINNAVQEWALDNPDLLTTRAADASAENRTVRQADVDGYIDGGLDSLEEPDNGSYLQTVGSLSDVVATINADESINDPVCSTGTTGHTL